MVDFTPPFGQDGERRLPNSTEQQLGFSCDPAQLRELFNGLFWLLQGQVKNIADEAGVVPSQDGDITLLKRAVLALIAASTGGETADDYLLMAQARTRLPIFPDVLHSDGHLGCLSPSTGTVRLPASLDFMHRGIFRVTTTQTDFVTDPSKTYHLRWNPTDGFVLRDLASGAYNPGSLAEMNPVFDSTYDDMLVARVITNTSNVATVTNLVNRDRLTAAVLRTETFTRTTGATGNILSPFGAEALNWARTPAVTGSISRYGYSTMLQRVPEDPIMLLSGSAMDGSGTATASASRYEIAPVGVVDTNLPATSFTFSYQISLMCQG